MKMSNVMNKRRKRYRTLYLKKVPLYAQLTLMMWPSKHLVGIKLTNCLYLLYSKNQWIKLRTF